MKVIGLWSLDRIDKNPGFHLVYWILKSVHWWLSYASFGKYDADDCCVSLIEPP